ncbi:MULTISPECIES: TetR/AcrR family transcriptional regulator [Streptomyces]|uniref:TetR/AcrR family transcriptional regulator n=1 Tax=Streptomyces TaxID=1883 RepID=UPI000C1A17BD|nr:MULTISPECIES: TetR/AcrR family transcriptional regulator [unclassified Streptomyces]MBQ0865475.1 TetR/AcrR family transcriptional regulator [Streptomyces sp. RK75]MBQ1121634.1 TetR/AcrR family transcriptional regulator [Streptomyces sp. B15]
MNKSQQRGARSLPAPRATERSQARRAELLAIGRKLFADTSYDALSMDDIARSAGVAKGLIYYYFTNKRGYYLAIIEEAVAELVARATSASEVPPAERVHRTIDGYLRYAQHNQAAYRTIVSGGVGHDEQVMAIHDRVREQLVGAIAEGAWSRTDISPLARTALVGWLASVEGVTLDWLARKQQLSREVLRELLIRTLRGTLEIIAEFDPALPPPTPPQVESRTRP